MFNHALVLTNGSLHYKKQWSTYYRSPCLIPLLANCYSQYISWSAKKSSLLKSIEALQTQRLYPAQTEQNRSALNIAIPDITYRIILWWLELTDWNYWVYEACHWLLNLMN